LQLNSRNSWCVIWDKLYDNRNKYILLFDQRWGTCQSTRNYLSNLSTNPPDLQDIFGLVFWYYIRYKLWWKHLQQG